MSLNYITDILYSLAPYTHYVSFFLLLLAGFNLPISEDIVIIVSASVAATIVPENGPLIFGGCVLGAYLSDITAYSIGKIAGRKILHLNFIKRLIPEERVNRMENYYEMYGGKTLFFGRFIPFGVRNVLFISAGISKFNFVKFLIIDFSALCITSAILFSLGYTFGENYTAVLSYINKYKIIILIITVILIVSLYIYKRMSVKEALKN